jgi:hypothetical protein
MMNVRRSAVLAVLAAAVMGAGSARVRAESDADRAPGDSVVYFHWAGAESLGAAYQSSHVKGIMDALHLHEFFAQQMAEADKAGTGADAKAAMKKAVGDWMVAAQQAPTSGYLQSVDFASGDKPVPKLAIFSKVGAETAAKLAKEIGDAEAGVKTDDTPPFAATVVNDYVLVTVGPDVDAAQRISGPAPTDGLGSTEAYKAALGQVAGAGGVDAPAIVYVNGEAVIRMIDEAAEAKGPAQARETWSHMKGALGLTGLKQLVFAGNFDGADWTSQGFIGLGDKRVGLLDFLDAPAIPAETYALIPADVAWANVAGVDASRFLEDMRNASADMGATAQRQFDFGMQQFFAFTGVNLKDDLLGALGTEYAFYGFASTPGADGKPTLGNFTMASKLKDAKKEETALSTLENVYNSMAGQRDPSAKYQFKTEPLAAPSDKVTAHLMALDTISPTWAIADGVLYFSMRKEGVQRAVDEAGKKGTLMDNASFAGLLKKLGQANLSTVGYADLPAMAPEIYAWVGKMLETAQKEHGMDKAAYTLPPLEALLPNLAPELQGSWMDKDGWHFKSVGPLPLANVIGPQGVIFQALLKNEAEHQKGGETKGKEALP